MQASVNQLSEWTGLDRRTVKRRLADLPHKPGPNRAHHYESVDALRVIYQGDSDAQRFDLAQEKARLAHHQANREAMREATERGELIEASMVREYGAAAMVATKQKLLAAASKLRGQFPDVAPEMIDRLGELHREALQELGENGLHDELRRRLTSVG